MRFLCGPSAAAKQQFEGLFLAVVLFRLSDAEQNTWQRFTHLQENCVDDFV